MVGLIRLISHTRIREGVLTDSYMSDSRQKKLSGRGHFTLAAYIVRWVQSHPCVYVDTNAKATGPVDHACSWDRPEADQCTSEVRDRCICMGSVYLCKPRPISRPQRPLTKQVKRLPGRRPLQNCSSVQAVNKQARGMTVAIAWVGLTIHILECTHSRIYIYIYISVYPLSVSTLQGIAPLLYYFWVCHLLFF